MAHKWSHEMLVDNLMRYSVIFGVRTAASVEWLNREKESAWDLCTFFSLSFISLSLLFRFDFHSTHRLRDNSLNARWDKFQKQQTNEKMRRDAIFASVICAHRRQHTARQCIKQINEADKCSSVLLSLFDLALWICVLILGWCARSVIAFLFIRWWAFTAAAAAVAIITSIRWFFPFCCLQLAQLSFINSDHFIDGGAFAFTCGANMLDWLLAAYTPP